MQTGRRGAQTAEARAKRKALRRLAEAKLETAWRARLIRERNADA